MQLIKEINFMEEKKYVIGLNIAAFVLIFPFTIFFQWLASMIYEARSYQFRIDGVFSVLICFFLILVIHELIHGLFFKVLGPAGTRVKFGFKNGMAYATSLGSFYQRLPFLIIGLAPFVLISLALTILALLHWIHPALYILVASLHAAGCVGDFYIAWAILCQESDILIEDTEVGMNFYQK